MHCIVQYADVVAQYVMRFAGCDNHTVGLSTLPTTHSFGLEPERLAAVSRHLSYWSQRLPSKAAHQSAMPTWAIFLVHRDLTCCDHARDGGLFYGTHNQSFCTASSQPTAKSSCLFPTKKATCMSSHLRIAQSGLRVNIGATFRIPAGR